MQTLNVSGFTNLKEIACPFNQLTNLDLTGLVNITNVECYRNQLTSLYINDLSNLIVLYCYSNKLTDLNINNLTNLTLLNCRVNQLASLDVNNLRNLTRLIADENQLTTLFIKNNNSSWVTLDLEFNSNLTYICADEADIDSVQQNVLALGYTNCHVNTYCDFTPGGVFYTIAGDKKIDGNNNGCDSSDSDYSFLKFTIISGTNTGSLISNATENYLITVPGGTHIITPTFENPTYFTASPSSVTVNFPTTASQSIQNFCIVPNSIYHDLEVVVFPLNFARLGFDAYKIKYKNKGNLNENATVIFNYNDLILDYVSSSLQPTEA